MSSALVKHQPPSFDRLIQTGLVLVRRAFLAVQEWPVDQLDPAVLHGLDAAGDLKDLAGGLFGIGVGSVSGEFHMPSSSSRMGRPGARKETRQWAQARGPLRPHQRTSQVRRGRSEKCRYSSLIPGLGVKLSNHHPCRAHCSLRGRGKPSA